MRCHPRWCVVSDLDPFADAAFVTRLQKLISMIGSGQEAEAEAARRKLLDHLTHHRLSLTDVAIRLGEGARPAAPPASFTGGAREMQLERQLSIARSARREAENDAALSHMQLADLQAILHRANIDMSRMIRAHSRTRYVAAAACAVAAMCLVGLAMPYLPTLSLPPSRLISVNHDGPVSLGSQGAAPEAPARLIATEQTGTAAVNDLAVRFNPNDNAGIRAFLNIGEHGLIERQAHVGQQDWLFIRTETGEGWVRSGDILH